jgi:hypothetical protein
VSLGYLHARLVGGLTPTTVKEAALDFLRACCRLLLLLPASAEALLPPDLLLPPLFPDAALAARAAAAARLLRPLAPCEKGGATRVYI